MENFVVSGSMVYSTLETVKYFYSLAIGLLQLPHHVTYFLYNYGL